MEAKRNQKLNHDSVWLTTSEAARYLGVSVDKMRELDETGELRANRTKGGHRRFSRKALDAYLARKAARASTRTQERPKPPSRPVLRPQHISDATEEDPEDFEPGGEEFEAVIEAPPPPPPPIDPLEKLAREMAERRKREEEEAPLRRLATLKQYGLNQIGWGVPDSWHARVAAALESYVTLKTFPAWVSEVDAYRIVRGKVEEVLQPYHDEVARKKAEETCREEEAATKRRQEAEEAQEERRIQALIDDGMRYARSETLSDWDYDDRARALRDVQRMLDDSIESDWTEQDVKDAVSDELDEWGDGDEEDES
jgi:excisionase family DNA binding protein